MSTISASTTTTTAYKITADTTGALVLQTGSGPTTAVTIDTSQNVGVGATPSAWGSGYASIQVGSSANIWAPKAAASQLLLNANGYYDGSAYRYINSNYASDYYQLNGQHVWRTAASGTAGNPITFTESMRIDSSGNLLVANTTASNSSDPGIKIYATEKGQMALVSARSTAAYDTLDMYSTGASAYRFYVDWGGTIHATSIVITAISDERLKENIRDLDTGLSTVMALKPRRYDWKEGKGQDKKDVSGFIAQEFEEVFPECVGTSKAGEDGIEYKNINYESLIPTLTKAIQEQQAIITTLTERITALEAK